MWKDWIKELFPLDYDHVLISYLPNKDKNGSEFDVRPWETKALNLQGKLFRGATSYPARGSYRIADSEGNIGEDVMIEKTRMVTSFITEKEFTEEALKKVSDFLKEFGKKTAQDSAAFVVDGKMYFIDI